ncbi:MAG: 23S rRNA (uracil(1939)-C(5))-methyltransferase RlmD [Clostridia bacterium]|nr:23S rRNA (uracil(1939)-C(5))-methyltransferase RlmD [Clostridia bacterium]
MPKKNDVIEVPVTDMNDLGYGIAHTEGKTVFVRGGVTGDILSAKIIKDAGSYFIAIPEKIAIPSNRRVPPACRYFPKCGGCSFCHIRYEYEKELKKGFVESCLRKERLFELTVLPVLSNEKAAGYRNKVQFPYVDGKLGYYAQHSHRVASGTDCMLHSKKAGEALCLLSDFLASHHVPSYDEETGEGLLRHVCLRCGAAGNAMLLTLVLNGRSFPYENELIALIESRLPAVRGLYYNVNTRRTNVILGDEYVHVWGEKTLRDQLLSCEFELSPASFYQVNREVCALLYKEVIARADPGAHETVVDLFCGVGTIGICLAKNRPVKKLIGVEIVPQAVENAKKNALLNGISNAEYYCADADHPALGEADTVIVDPPRKGLDERLVRRLSEIRRLSKIVYVSCNPATLARDLARFRNFGWKIGELQPVDMFPRTGHVETVVQLSRQ